MKKQRLLTSETARELRFMSEAKRQAERKANINKPVDGFVNWKPLQLTKPGYQRPTYDAPGMILRGEPEGVVLV